MAQQIIRQPNGKYCIYSTITDNVTHYNMTIDEIVNILIEDSKKELRQKILNIENGKNHFSLSYEEMLEQIFEIHGKYETKKVKKLIEQ